MKKQKWNTELIVERCKELGIVFLDEQYSWDVKNNFKCSCGNHFERLFLNVHKGQDKCAACIEKRKEEIVQERLDLSFEKLKKYILNETNLILLHKRINYSHNKQKITVICNCGKVFFPNANNIMTGKTKCCISCGRKKISEKNRADISLVIKHVESENYTFHEYMYLNNALRVFLTCEKGHDSFWTNYSNFRKGHRCPHCTTSQGERAVAKALNNLNVFYQIEHTIEDMKGVGGRVLRFDFFINEGAPLAIEYDGIQHYEPKFGKCEFEKTQKNDMIKNDYCLKNGIILHRIKYTDFDNIETIIHDIIREYRDNLAL